jgi:hypothetical protein
MYTGADWLIDVWSNPSSNLHSLAFSIMTSNTTSSDSDISLLKNNLARDKVTNFFIIRFLFLFLNKTTK